MGCELAYDRTKWPHIAFLPSTGFSYGRFDGRKFFSANRIHVYHFKGRGVIEQRYRNGRLVCSFTKCRWLECQWKEAKPDVPTLEVQVLCEPIEDFSSNHFRQFKPGKPYVVVTNVSKAS